jgi:cysteinyl-tRNA synthetase
MLHIYNSLTRRKEPFRPLEAGKVRLYVCGMTVYDYCHVGHARVLVVFDVVTRYLRWRGLQVTYVRNITDIDDKIIQRANENKEDIGALTARFIQAMHEDIAALGVLAPDVEPRATEQIERIVEMVQALLEKGYAYPAPNGDIYYDVSQFDHYGQLSGKRIEDLRAGARVEVDLANKDDPLDFALWKASKAGEPSWDSPWGPGRPGWHIECSAMSTACLGAHFDIHGGGQDLQFPHHENEIAQSEAATGEPFVNCWMHNGFVRVDDEKMSKSLGNFFTLREVFAEYDPEVVRYFILTSHYRSPLNYSDENLDQAKGALTRLYIALAGLELTDVKDVKPSSKNRYIEHFSAAMDDDFNTPEALAVLFELAHAINRAKEGGETAQAISLGALLRHLGGVLGLLERAPEVFLQGSEGTGPEDLSTEQIQALIEARQAARRNKDWSEADRIREELKAHSIALEDTPAGTQWRRA